MGPRPRRDTKLTPRQACVFGSFRPAVACSRAAIPEISAHIARALAGGSCDEYPFASTSEGGAGASIANVPVAEQRAQGGLMSGFYSAQRMLDGDAFRVAVVP